MMGRCPICTTPTPGEGELCSFHLARDVDQWSAANRTVCDMIHRRIPPRQDAAPGGDGRGSRRERRADPPADRLRSSELA